MPKHGKDKDKDKVVAPPEGQRVAAPQPTAQASAKKVAQTPLPAAPLSAAPSKSASTEKATNKDKKKKASDQDDIEHLAADLAAKAEENKQAAAKKVAAANLAATLANKSTGVLTTTNRKKKSKKSLSARQASAAGKTLVATARSEEESTPVLGLADLVENSSKAKSPKEKVTGSISWDIGKAPILDLAKKVNMGSAAGSGFESAEGRRGYGLIARGEAKALLEDYEKGKKNYVANLVAVLFKDASGAQKADPSLQAQVKKELLAKLEKVASGESAGLLVSRGNKNDEAIDAVKKVAKQHEVDLKPIGSLPLEKEPLPLAVAEKQTEPVKKRPEPTVAGLPEELIRIRRARPAAVTTATNSKSKSSKKASRRPKATVAANTGGSSSAVSAAEGASKLKLKPQPKPKTPSNTNSSGPSAKKPSGKGLFSRSQKKDGKAAAPDKRRPAATRSDASSASTLTPVAKPKKPAASASTSDDSTSGLN